MEKQKNMPAKGGSASGGKNKYLTTDIVLRVSLALMFLYAGVSQILDPLSWVGFVPAWALIGPVTAELFLYANAAFELFVAGLLVWGRFKKAVGWLAAVHFILIVIVNGPGQLLVTFRDVGLAGAAIAYAFSGR